MKIAGVQMDYFNNVQSNQQRKYPNLAPLQADCVTFGKKDTAKPIVTGSDYSEIDKMDTRRSKTIPELVQAKKDGSNISEDREKLILSRINSVLDDVENFIAQHPEVACHKDDLTQELILSSITETDKQLKNGVSSNYTSGYQRLRDIIFTRILADKKETALSDIRNLQDERDYSQEIVDKNALQEQIASVLQELTPREEVILKKRFGLGDETPKTLEAIGKEFNIDRGRVKTIEDKAITKLRHPSRSRKLKPFY